MLLPFLLHTSIFHYNEDSSFVHFFNTLCLYFIYAYVLVYLILCFGASLNEYVANTRSPIEAAPCGDYSAQLEPPVRALLKPHYYRQEPNNLINPLGNQVSRRPSVAS